MSRRSFDSLLSSGDALIGGSGDRGGFVRHIDRCGSGEDKREADLRRELVAGDRNTYDLVVWIVDGDSKRGLSKSERLVQGELAV